MLFSLLHELLDWDRRLLIWLNSFHTDWLDPVMYYTSQTFFWLPLYVFLIWLIVKDFKKEWWVPIIGIIVTIVLADQITTSLMKPFFARLRPSQEPSLQGIVHLVRDYHGEIYTGGLYGFASSHASNVFALAMFFWLLFRRTYKSTALLFAWAAIVAYTRIYLGVHFPGDVIVGAAVGVLAAWIGYQLCKAGFNRLQRRLVATPIEPKPD